MAIETVTRTILSSYIQSHLMLGLPYRPVDFTTLNEKLDISPSVHPNPNETLNFNFFCIGNGGHRSEIGEDNVHIQVPRQQRPTWLSPFNITPFVVRDLSQDLSAADRRRYCLRKVITNPRDNRQYIAYYGRWFDKTNTRVKMTQFRIENGKVVDVSDFVPTSDNLNPIPSDLTNEGANVVDGRYVRTSSIVDISFTAQDVTELRNAATILKGSDVYAFFTELGVCASVNRAIDVQTPGSGTFSFNEALEAMVTNHLNVNYQALYFNQGFDLALNFGSTEPLFNIERVNNSGFGVSVGG